MRSCEVADWAASGAMWLTGWPEEAPLLPPGRAASFVREQLAGLGLEIPGLLGERAAYAALGRNGPWSCGGAFRTIRTLDGWLGLSLSRPSDLDLVPALIEADVPDDPWPAVMGWAAECSSEEAEERLRLLGLPGGALPLSPPADRPAVVTTVLGQRSPHDGPPRVVDLTGLWAGPLCAHLLGLAGAQVVKVESLARPDAARFGSPEMFDLLHRGHDQTVLDFGSELDLLRDLIADADLVLESSRPRGLRQLGILAEEAVAAGTSWLSITARGRASDAVGFGDDVAAAAGLVVEHDGRPMPVGDAIADPLTGVAAAAAASEALRSEEARLVDVSMLHVVAETLVGTGPGPEHAVRRAHGGWWVETADGCVPVRPPRRRGQRR